MMDQPDRRLQVKAKLFAGFADPLRLAILEALRERPRTVSELVELTGRGQSSVSSHLGCLLDCGLVTRSQDGRFARYALADARIATILEGAEGVLIEAALGVLACTNYQVAASEPVPSRAAT